MASVHALALTHLVGAGIGVTLVATVLRRLLRGTSARARVRADYAPARRRPARSFLRLIARLVRATVRSASSLGLALAAPVGMAWANRRYPLVAPVLVPFEDRLAALGHRPAHARCYPLLGWRWWLVRCAGCRQRSLFREVSSPDRTAVELKVLGTSPWRTQPCTAEYLTVPTAPSGQTTPTATAAHPVRPVRPVRRRTAFSSQRAGGPDTALPPSAVTDTRT